MPGTRRWNPASGGRWSRRWNVSDPADDAASFARQARGTGGPIRFLLRRYKLTLPQELIVPLSGIAPFQGMSPEHRALLEVGGTMLEPRDGSIVLHEGEAPDAVYAV